MNASPVMLQRHTAALRCLMVGVFLFTLLPLSQAQSFSEFHKVVFVTNAEPVKLAVDISRGDVEIVYSRDEQVSVSAVAQASGTMAVDENYFRVALRVDQTGNRVTVQHLPNFVYQDENFKLRFRIDVPYRTEVTSAVTEGKQIVRGVTGPVYIKGGRGDVSVSYVSGSVRVEAERANVDFEMVGERVDAHTGSGNISGERLPKGIHAETGDGDIKLTVVGDSEAIVKTGSGRIEVGAARDKLAATTDSGDLRVQAVPHNDWRLNSTSGSVRIELPPQAGFDLAASSESGKLQLEREDLPSLSADTHQVLEKIGGGGRRIEAHTKSGNISIR